jgi:transporter family-2 protein
VLSIVGIVLISREKGSGSTNGKSGKVLAFVILDILAGFVAAMQVAVNGTMTVVAGSALRSTFISMSGALVTTFVIIGLIILFKGKRAVYDDGMSPESRPRITPFLLTGGLMALVVVGGNAITGPVLGTGVVTIMNLFGMMASGLVIDATGFLGINKKPVTAVKVFGMLLMLAGTAMISL